MVAYRKGELTAFDTLFFRYERKVYNFLLKRVGKEETAADLFQEVFLRVHKNREGFNPQASFAAWLFTIAHNLIKDHYKRRGIEVLSATGEQAVLEAEPTTPFSQLARKELGEAVRQALQQLPNGQREVVELSAYGGLRYPEIAQVTHQSVGAVKQKAHRAFLNLREKLRPYRPKGENA